MQSEKTLIFGPFFTQNVNLYLGGFSLVLLAFIVLALNTQIPKMSNPYILRVFYTLLTQAKELIFTPC
tara:strand:- start:3282 stop:3485 length:204 start_codon:yes stop_codon:yes gene_type:complete